MQLSMLRQLLNKKLINEFEYEKIKKRLMKDYNIYLILRLDLSSVLQYNEHEHYGGNTKKEAYGS